MRNLFGDRSGVRRLDERHGQQPKGRASREYGALRRGGFRYHGVIRAIADGAREAGLKF